MKGKNIFDNSLKKCRRQNLFNIRGLLQNKPYAGFTVMELFIVIIIIAILAGALTVRIVDKTRKVKISKANAEMKMFTSAYVAFKMDTGYYAKVLDDLTKATTPATVYDETMTSVNSPAGMNFNGPYLEVETLGSNPIDPWGTIYRFTDTKTPNTKVWYIQSAGEDKSLGTGDDLWVFLKKF